ncbi:NitT/TauT family transport system permease protein [Rhizobiales bacterium GAS113]|nr:NitT/TauT family transport system permease protein [Rhizobiales bacterium GAS113]
MSTESSRLAARRLVVLATMLGLWEALARFGVLNPFYVPPPSKVAATLFALFTEGEIWTHMEATFGAALLGLALGVMVGAFLGVAAALLPHLGEILNPAMTVLNAVPRIILAPLFVIWFGIGIASKVAVTFVLIAVLFFFAIYTGIKEVDQRLVERVKTLGGGRSVLLREVYLPAVTAWALSNLKIAVGFAFTGAVVGEFVASSRGLGYLLSFAQSTYNASLTLALLLLIMVVVFVLFALAGTLEKRLLRWR